VSDRDGRGGGARPGSELNGATVCRCQGRAQDICGIAAAFAGTGGRRFVHARGYGGPDPHDTNGAVAKTAIDNVVAGGSSYIDKAWSVLAVALTVGVGIEEITGNHNNADAANAATAIYALRLIDEVCKICPSTRMPGTPVKAYQVGQFGEMSRAPMSRGDGLDLHHIPQTLWAEGNLPGFTRDNGIAIALPQFMHQEIDHWTRRTFPVAPLSNYDLLRRELRILRRVGRGAIPECAFRLIEGMAAERFGIR
jgi:hypothetical protein